MYSRMNCLIENAYIKGTFQKKKISYVFTNELPNWKRILKGKNEKNGEKKVGVLYYGGGLLIFSRSWRTLFWGGLLMPPQHYVHEGFLAVGIFTQTYYWMISCGGHAYGAKSSANICRITVSPQLLMVETHFVGKGWPSTNPHCNLTSLFDDRDFVRQGYVLWTSIHAALPLEEKN